MSKKQKQAIKPLLMHNVVFEKNKTKKHDFLRVLVKILPKVLIKKKMHEARMQLFLSKGSVLSFDILHDVQICHESFMKFIKKAGNGWQHKKINKTKPLARKCSFVLRMVFYVVS